MLCRNPPPGLEAPRGTPQGTRGTTLKTYILLRHTYTQYVVTYDTYNTYFWCGTRMLVWVLIYYVLLFSVPFPVSVRALVRVMDSIIRPRLALLRLV